MAIKKEEGKTASMSIEEEGKEKKGGGSVQKK